MIEKENKYLLNCPFDFYLKKYVESSIEIKQGYLCYNKKSETRVRIVNSSKAYICTKTKISKNERYEIENEIDINLGFILYNNCKYKLEKTRHIMKNTEKTNITSIYLDCQIFNKKEQPLFVEIEFTGSEPNVLPFYCGKQIHISNFKLAKDKY